MRGNKSWLPSSIFSCWGIGLFTEVLACYNPFCQGLLSTPVYPTLTNDTICLKIFPTFYLIILSAYVKNRRHSTKDVILHWLRFRYMKSRKRRLNPNIITALMNHWPPKSFEAKQRTKLPYPENHATLLSSQWTLSKIPLYLLRNRQQWTQPHL